MELVLSTKNLKHSSGQKQVLINKPSGFLTSQYKRVVKTNYKANKASSIFGIKQRLNSKSFATSCAAETTLKLSLFLASILLIFN